MKRPFLKFKKPTTFGPLVLVLALSNVLQADGADNAPGIQAEILYNVKDNLTAVPDLPASPAADADYVTIDDDFTVSGTSYFKKLGVTLESGRVKGTRVGDRDGGQYKYTAEFLFSDSVAAQAFTRKMANSRGYFVITEMDGTKVLIGSNSASAYCTIEEYDGGQIGQEKGPAYKGVITGYGPTAKPPIFTGAAPIS